MNEQEISVLLQERGRPGATEPDKPVIVTFCNGAYGKPTVAVIEVEGSPNKGMAIIRWEVGDASTSYQPSGQSVWLLENRAGMRKLPEGEKEKAIVNFARSRYNV
jgi:hypothetical protein